MKQRIFTIISLTGGAVAAAFGGWDLALHEALRQRITVHYNFSGLSDDEVARYVLHKLTCAGGSETMIEKAALSAIHSHSQGNPRLIDNLMTDALALGSQMEKKSIDAEVILAAVSNQNLM